MPAVHPVIRLEKVTAYCSIQDLGRYGFRHLGVPTAGPMDTQNAMLCNQLLGNLPDAPLLEIIGPGMEMQVLQHISIAITGAVPQITVDGLQVFSNQVLCCLKGQSIRIGQLKQGNIVYFGIAGGFWKEKVLTSVSPLVSGKPGRLLPQTTLLGNENRSVKSPSSHISIPEINMEAPITVMKGPEFHWLSEENRQALFTQSFSITTRADRMGFLLSGKAINRTQKREMRTSSVMPGVVQWLPDGQLLVLMRDCQTTGGYPRILVIQEASLNQLAQRCPGSFVRFHTTEEM